MFIQSENKPRQTSKQNFHLSLSTPIFFLSPDHTGFGPSLHIHFPIDYNLELVLFLIMNSIMTSFYYFHGYFILSAFCTSAALDKCDHSLLLEIFPMLSTNTIHLSNLTESSFKILHFGGLG